MGHPGRVHHLGARRSSGCSTGTYRSPTHQMYRHRDVTTETGIPMYFCDPHSSW